MTVLSDKEIIIARAKGDIVIAPFKMRNLSTSSYDVCLGEYYYEANSTNMHFYNPYDKRHIDAVWQPLKKATKLSTLLENSPDKSLNECLGNSIKLNDELIIVPPLGNILAHTQEFIGAVRHHTSEMRARSSFGRSMINVCSCAGWGDVGFVNRWTMEIFNRSPHYHAVLVVGRRIAQIAFLQCGDIIDKSYGETGKYQQGSDLQYIMDTWEPSMMLPQLHKDKDIQI